jgi:hypothetical protein
MSDLKAAESATAASPNRWRVPRGRRQCCAVPAHPQYDREVTVCEVAVSGEASGCFSPKRTTAQVTPALGRYFLHGTRAAELGFRRDIRPTPRAHACSIWSPRGAGEHRGASGSHLGHIKAFREVPGDDRAFPSHPQRHLRRGGGSERDPRLAARRPRSWFVAP